MDRMPTSKAEKQTNTAWQQCGQEAGHSWASRCVVTTVNTPSHCIHCTQFLQCTSSSGRIVDAPHCNCSSSVTWLWKERLIISQWDLYEEGNSCCRTLTISLQTTIKTFVHFDEDRNSESEFQRSSFLTLYAGLLGILTRDHSERFTIYLQNQIMRTAT